MLHNYATRDWSDRDHEKGGGRAAAAGAREVERKKTAAGAEKKFFGAAGRPERGERASDRATPSG